VSPRQHEGASLDGTLGDFRILREIGRGGMGVVYEAEQISLGRRVALKVLPFAATLDPRQLQRFQNEAHAAAHLQHQNIVPVYAVGSERGVQYYAMQLIEGQTLAALIAQMRPQARPGPSDPCVLTADKPAQAPASATPPVAALSTEWSAQAPAYFHTVARLGAQAAEALEHAHQLGVVHRDIKPANLLLDGRGNLWVTDFGLAQVRSEAGLTLTGDLVGTVRYMSPEQALGKRGLVDQRTDLYSLGVTLYELLTLEPAYAGNDRQELLRRIAVEEPRHPRQLNRAVPAELETVVLKAMAKDPAERYGSARELADDLRRFLEDRPVRARRPSPWRRARQWARRHRPLVVTAGLSAAVALVIAVVLLAVANVQIRAQEAQKAAALDAEAAQRERAEENLRLALRAMDEVILKPVEGEVARKERQGQLPLTPQELDRLDRDLLQKGLDFYEQFARANSADPLLRGETGKAYYRVGYIRLTLGQHAGAEAAFRQSIPILEGLAQVFPDVPEHRRTLAGNYHWLGRVLKITDRRGETEEVLRKDVAASEQLVAESPAVVDYRVHLYDACRALGDFLKDDNRHPEAEQAYRRALDLARQLAADSPNAVESRNLEHGAQRTLGDILKADRHYPEAEQAYRRALDLARQLAADFPTVIDYRDGQHTVLCALGDLFADAGRYPEAAQAYRQTLDVLAQMVADFPREGHRHPETEQAYRRFLSVAQHLVPESPIAAEYRERQLFAYRYLGDIWRTMRLTPREQIYFAHRSLGDLFKDQSRYAEAAAAYGQALDVVRQLAADFPDMAERRHDLALSQRDLARCLLHIGRLAEAEQCYRQSIRVLEQLAVKFPDESDYPYLLMTDQVGLGDVLLVAGRFEDAAGAYGRAVEIKPDSARAHWKLAWFLANCPDARQRDPRRAIELAKKAAAQAPDNGDYWKTLGLAYYRAGDWGRAIAYLTRAGDVCVEDFPLAMAYWQQGDKEQARWWYERGCWWMEKYKGGYSKEPCFYWEEEFCRLRAEAAALLKIEDDRTAPKGALGTKQGP
jgi:serine/threonine protein kinase